MPAGGTVPGFLDEAGLGAADLAVGVLVLDPAEEPVGDGDPFRMLFCRGGGPGMGGQDLPADVVLYSGLQYHRHVGEGTVVAGVIEADTVREVGGVREPQLCQLLVHEVREGLPGAGGAARQRAGCVRTGGKDGAVEKVPHRDSLIDAEAGGAAVVPVGVVGVVDGDREGLVQGCRPQMLRRYQNRQDLGHGGGDDRTFPVLPCDDLAGIHVDKDRMVAHAFTGQCCGHRRSCVHCVAGEEIRGLRAAGVLLDCARCFRGGCVSAF